MPKKIKFAVVGFGHIGKRHAAMIDANEECELIAICDIKSKKELGIESSNLPFFKSIESLLDSNLVLDIINICTPNGYHAKQCTQALSKQKHVLCEKPMGLAKSECEEVIFKALNVNRQVFVVMQNRYSPPIVWLKKMIQEQHLGEIFMVEINCYWNRDDRYYKKEKGSWRGTKKLDGGTLFTQFAHFIDIMYWVFGDIENIKSRFADFAHSNNTEFEDSGISHFDFVNGGMGCLSFSTAVWGKNMESSITVIGSKGSLKIGGQYMNELKYCHVEGIESPQLPAASPPNEYGTYKGSAANHHYVIQNVVDVLKGRKEPTTNALEGLKVVDIIERIYNSTNKNENG